MFKTAVELYVIKYNYMFVLPFSELLLSSATSDRILSIVELTAVWISFSLSVFGVESDDFARIFPSATTP